MKAEFAARSERQDNPCGHVRHVVIEILEDGNVNGLREGRRAEWAESQYHAVLGGSATTSGVQDQHPRSCSSLALQK